MSEEKNEIIEESATSHKPEKQNASTREGGNQTMTLSTIAVVLSVIAITISLVILLTSEGGRKEATSELSDKLNAVLLRIETVEDRIAAADTEGQTERTGRGILELKKALLSFQEARTLIKDDELVNKLLKIEDEMKSFLVLPEAKDTGEGADVDVSIPSEDMEMEAAEKEMTEPLSQPEESEAYEEREEATETVIEEETKQEEEIKPEEEKNEVMPSVNEESVKPES